MDDYTILESVTFTGEYPTGVYWLPGERRELPRARVQGDLPLGLFHVGGSVTATTPAKPEPTSREKA